MMMRAYNTKNWVKLLPQAVELLNARPMKRNAGIAPSQINSMYDDVLIEDARAATGSRILQPDRTREAANQFDADKQTTGFKLGAYVYLDKKRLTFEKSFGDQVTA